MLVNLLLGSAVFLPLVLSLFMRTQLPLMQDFDPSAILLAEGNDTTSYPKSVPGESPAYYIGDPTNDVLVIKGLDLIPNPPVE